MPNHLPLTTVGPKIETGSTVLHGGHMFSKSEYWYHGSVLR